MNVYVRSVDRSSSAQYATREYSDIFAPPEVIAICEHGFCRQNIKLGSFGIQTQSD